MATKERSALTDEIARPKVRPQGYVALILGLIIFSGIFANSGTFLKFLDYTNLIGEFGKLSDIAKNVQGVGGSGARDGFFYAMTIWPSTVTSIGLINVIEGQDGLKAGQRLLNFILKPLIGVPGWASLAITANLFASTDASAILALDLKEEKLITEKEYTILACFLFVASGFIASALGQSGGYIKYVMDAGIPLGIILLAGLIGKVFAGALMRIFLSITKWEDNEPATEGGNKE